MVDQMCRGESSMRTNPLRVATFRIPRMHMPLVGKMAIAVWRQRFVFSAAKVPETTRWKRNSGPTSDCYNTANVQMNAQSSLRRESRPRKNSKLSVSNARSICLVNFQAYDGGGQKESRLARPQPSTRYVSKIRLGGWTRTMLGIG